MTAQQRVARMTAALAGCAIAGWVAFVSTQAPADATQFNDSHFHLTNYIQEGIGVPAVGQVDGDVGACQGLLDRTAGHDIHRNQAAVNRRLIARADANGQFRLADNLRHVQTSLDRIIPALEALDHDPPT